MSAHRHRTPSVLRRLACAGGVIGLALVTPSLAVAAAAAATHTIVIDGTAFSPAKLEVHRGDRVVWVNKDPFPHTATAKDHSFDSHNIAASKSWSYVARKAGTFDYVCTLHPTMTGTLVVR